jgi:hypothetical protein
MGFTNCQGELQNVRVRDGRLTDGDGGCEGRNGEKGGGKELHSYCLGCN